MKIIITGSLGNIGKVLTPILVQKGHDVTVITTKADKQKNIEALGAKAAIGSMKDVDFLIQTFKGADIVYLMEAWEGIGNLFDKEVDFLAGFHLIGNNYKKAVLTSGVKKIVHLSSVGAHSATGYGAISAHYDVENILKQLPNDIAIKFIRPTSFYTNLYRSMQSIKEKGAIISNHGGDKKEPWVSPLDIADAIAEEMELPFEGRKVRYLASDEISPNELVKIIGEAIGNPNLKWIQISDAEMLEAMLSKGVNNEIAKGLVEMQASQRSGLLYEDFYRNIPTFGKTKFIDFVKEFALEHSK
ncbi:NmrA family NAD(P)-binding protein [Flavobacterium sp. Fl-77]|uniref:NmrA family NAD(P)-binding protein n=1 Tax=Flavobacterium flavipigmentatum TaxID=2893884 RepID=A0AAJ2VYS0_9FLAO|nr:MULTISPECIES: NmrA family NAD(P)-binding protein [unclassified Flavobacterium]MDX6183936.1 NmrA family NAD(P)-binding protein [Flavobacterium sp. Fl-33]MDX6187498.1 NmrA family NAD(P)-binding protein [Flavobacterium sp. Fl-77]UFH37664.1 NmrA family NAD(P)-binding protein [Flavobacterium sp. F-70]